MKGEYDWIGFSDFDELTDDVIHYFLSNRTLQEKRKVGDKTEVEVFCENNENSGMIMRGHVNESTGKAKMNFFLPVHINKDVSLEGYVGVRKETVREAKRKGFYLGSVYCPQSGKDVVFALQNLIIGLRNDEYKKEKIYSVHLSGMASEGKILLPATVNQNVNTRIAVVASKSGLDKPEYGLVPPKNPLKGLSDYDYIQNRGKKNKREFDERIKGETVYSVVDTMLNALFCESDTYMQEDIYMVVGNITKKTKQINKITGEEIYILKVLCTEYDVNIDICINSKALLGEPDIGRRFAGKVMMQGWIDWRD